MPSCHQCSAAFEITPQDLEFFEKVSPVFDGKKELIPPPTFCPDCRMQRRFSFRNERKLYHRKSDLSGRQIISMYSQDKPFKIFDQEEWWSDQFDPLAYGRDFDFSRPFFEQYKELFLDVPKLSIQNAKSENCAFTNYSAQNKNCYLIVGGLGAEDCYYSYRVFYSKDIVDCYDLFKCELCYECCESKQLSRSSFCRHCHDSSDLILCSFCSGCHDCFGCVNLRNKQFCIFNEQYSKEEYLKKVAELRENMPEAMRKAREREIQAPHKALNILQCEDSSGDSLIGCKNCIDCYVLKGSENCKFGAFGEDDRSCMDVNFCDSCELHYESSNLQENYSIQFGCLVWYCSDCMYVSNCFNSKFLFGCTGMKKNQYCILNKQYSKEEYEALLPKIIDHMRTTKEWGEFFPTTLSPFAYNESLSFEEFPVSKENVIERGWQWFDDDQSENYLGPTPVPLRIEEVSDDIVKQILTCSVTGKPYKIIPQELKFYRSMNLPIPLKCPDQRHKERMALRNPRQLWNRNCQSCQKAIETTYSPKRPEIVYCEECYLSTVY